ncbi:MFS transporter [Paenibacillus sp. VMFN-D1]|uniref:MFS transporter n=1 Tax=Paenibacillus sp. VMFN-D1 TaxID=2135608 RepID=UPI000E264357|nr:MFS transporter [Paenibacillus sp. VMFN-D1]RED35101.1 EmrB/QacA subfamily drug resistance transporter [Paenibacillus sp. VMFN-D1]
MSTTQDMSPTVASSRHPELVLACVCACTILVVGLVAAINLAVPMLAASGLHPSSSELLWIVDAYVVVFACLVIPGGAAGDRFGRKGVLIAGLVAFAAGAAFSAASASVPVMLIGRAITGVGAALVLPNCIGVLVHATAPERRGGALAIWGAMSGMGGLVGNIAGAALLTTGSWRFLFAAIVPVALLCALGVTLTVRRSSRSARTLDPAGTVLLVAATVALLIGIIEGPEQGWSSAVVITAFAASVVLSAVWVVVELRTRQPLLDPRLFRIPMLSGASLGMLVMFFGSFGLFYLNASLLQYGRGYSVIQTGLAIVPMTVPMMLGARFVPGLVKRIGIPLTLSAAFLAIGIGLLGLSFAANQPYVVYAAWLVLIGIGFTLALPCLTAEITAALPSEQAGVAGGLQSATRELGSALGVAVVGTVLTASFTRHLPATLQHQDPIPRTVSEAVEAASNQHAAIIDAFTTGADTALRVASVVTLLAGVLVIAVATQASRQSRERKAAATAAATPNE